MIEIVVASKNPVKVDATRIGFERMFPQLDFSLIPTSVPSGVADQPMTYDETFQGALNRAQSASNKHPQSQYAIGIEGGIEVVNDQLEVFAWVVILSAGRMGRAQTGVFYLPKEVADLVQAGHELGHADDIVFKRNNSKQGNGSIGLLTDDALTRTDYYVQAVIMALIPFKKPNFTWL